jgi:hypothetical protein
VKIAWLTALVSALIAGTASAQTELSGPARDIARAVLVYPVVFDPLIVMPLTPGPEVGLDAHGGDVEATAHAALKSGDDSYGLVFSVPFSDGGTTTDIDPRGLQHHASLGFHITNIIWRPKATPALERQLGSEGFVRLTDAQRTALAETIATTDAVRAPWAIFMTADYRYNRAEYVFADRATLARQTDTRLNDTASMLAGVQLFAKPRDPGYFFGASYTYNAVFSQFGGNAPNGLPAEGPKKVRGNLVRAEMRRPIAAGRVGVNPSFAYDVTLHVKTVEAVGYWFPKRAHGADRGRFNGYDVGLRVGHTSDEQGHGGGFVSVFAGWSFPASR